MPWIFFLLALGCLALAMRTQSMGFALLLLLATLGFMLAGALGLVSARIRARTQGGLQLNPVLERQAMRKSGPALNGKRPNDPKGEEGEDGEGCSEAKAGHDAGAGREPGREGSA